MSDEKEDLKWRIRTSLKFIEIFVITGILLSITFAMVSISLDKIDTSMLWVLFFFLSSTLLLLLVALFLFVRVDRFIFGKNKAWRWG